MSRGEAHWLGDPVLVPRWRHPAVLGAMVAHLAAAVVLPFLPGAKDADAFGDGLVLTAALLVLPVLATVVVVSARSRPRGDAGQVLLRAGYGATALVPGAVVAGALGIAVAVLVPDPDGVDAALGGATLGLLTGGLLGCCALLLVGGSLRFVLENVRLPWFLRASLPLTFAGMLAMAVGAALGAGPDAPGGRSIVVLVRALAGSYGVQSQVWIWTGRAGALAFVGGLALLVLALKDRRASRTPL